MRTRLLLSAVGVLTMSLAPIVSEQVSVAAQIYDWTTIAGLATNSGSANGTNSDALFNHPSGVAVDTDGTLYVADTFNNTVRKIAPVGTNWVTTTIAGAGNTGSTDGTNSDARFHNPYGVAMDTNGTLYVADTLNNTVRKIAPVGTNWMTTTIAGAAGVSGAADGTNSDARFHNPYGVVVDPNGNLYVADTINDTVRKIAPVGTNWVTTTIAGTVTNAGSADGTNSDALFHYPVSVTLDSVGDLYVVDHMNCTIRKITPVGTNWVTTTIAGLAGHIGSTDGTNSVARFKYPYGVVVDTNDNLYVTDNENSTIRKIAPVGTNWVTATIGGAAGLSGATDGINNCARFFQPWGVAVDSGGNVYVADYDNDTIRLGVPLPWGTLTIIKETAKLNFAKTNSDSCTLTGTLTLEPGFSITNAPVTVDIGGAQTSFILDAKGRGASPPNTCKLTYKKKTGPWTFTATLKSGSWASQWETYGLSNVTTTVKAGVPVTLPVTLVVGNDGFYGEKALLYKAKVGKSGSAK